MDITVYLKNNPIDYKAAINLLTTSTQLTGKDLNKLEILCVDYRLQQLNSNELSALLNYAQKELEIRKVMFKYEQLQTLIETFDFLFLCAINNELNYFKKIVSESKYIYLFNLPTHKKDKANIFKDLWEVVIYYFYSKFTNLPINMEVVNNNYSKEKMKEEINLLSKLDPKDATKRKYQAMLCSGYLFVSIINLFEDCKYWDNPYMYYNNEKLLNSTFDNIIFTLVKVDFTIEPIIIEYVKKLIGKLIIAKTIRNG